MDNTSDYWIGKVSGSKKEIENALNTLGRTPKDVNELQGEINRQIIESLGKILKEADEQRNYTPF